MTITERPTEGYRDTVARLASAQKGAASGAPAYSIYINRRLGRFIAAAAYRAGLTPNGVTAISAALTFTGILLLATVEPVWWSGVLIWVLLALGYAFDSADGQVARLRGGGSAAGEWLDHVVDALKISSLHIAVLISAYRFFDLPSDAWLLVPIGFSIVANVTFFAMILNDQLKHVRGRKGTAESGGGSRLRSFLVIPTDYGLLCFVFVLLGAPAVFFVAYALLFAANAGFLMLAAVKWFRDMVALDAPESEGAR